MEKIIVNSNLDLDISSLNKDLFFDVLKDQECFVYFSNLSKDNNVEISIQENAILHLSILADSPIEKMNLVINLAKNSHLITYFADFSTMQNNSDIVINLNGNAANATWHLASLASKNDKKEIAVSVFHNAKSTFAKVDNYGVAKDNSKLVFSGTSHILNGMSKSKTHQNAKIMVFDPLSDAVAKPILKIDENDIEASHAAVVGKISDEHIFYLTSRGLSLDEARMLITLGYLKPIFKGFDEQKVEKINNIMGGLL